MSVHEETAAELARIEAAKAAIAAAIAGKGVTVPDSILLDGMAALIEAIEGGGGLPSGVKWEKFDCAIETTEIWTKQTGAPDGSTYIAFRNGNKYIWKNKYFSSSAGFYGTELAEIDLGDASTVIGHYYIATDGTDTGKVTAISLVNGSTDIYKISYTDVETATKGERTTYSQGATSYGVLTASEGELPEEGTVTEGSADDDYCVLEVNGTYYYYVKQISSAEFQSMIEEVL